MTEAALSARTSWNRDHDAFRAKLNMSQPCDHDDKFPDKVTYAPVCGAMCETASSPERLFLYKQVIEAMNVIVRRFGVGRGISTADLVLAIEVHPPSNRPRRHLQLLQLSDSLTCGRRTGSSALMSLDLAYEKKERARNVVVGE